MASSGACRMLTARPCCRAAACLAAMWPISIRQTSGVAWGLPAAAGTRCESQFTPLGMGPHSVHCARSNRQGVEAGIFCLRGFPWVSLTTSFKAIAGPWSDPRHAAKPMMPADGFTGAGGALSGGDTTHFCCRRSGLLVLAAPGVCLAAGANPAANAFSVRPTIT
jgi:hypothetical protein